MCTKGEEAVGAAGPFKGEGGTLGCSLWSCHLQPVTGTVGLPMDPHAGCTDTRPGHTRLVRLRARASRRDAGSQRSLKGQVAGGGLAGRGPPMWGLHGIRQPRRGKTRLRAAPLSCQKPAFL